jgi:hypothetical protein
VWPIGSGWEIDVRGMSHFHSASESDYLLAFLGRVGLYLDANLPPPPFIELGGEVFIPISHSAIHRLGRA